MSEPTAGTAVKMVKNISDAAVDVKETATELGRHATNQIEAIRETIAGTMDETSSAVQSGGQQISEIADVAAEKIQNGARYVRRTDLRVMGTNAKDFVKRNPALSVLLGAAVGLLVAWSFRSEE
jgi:ElaB/YqjD/DUF883 family membrane-anchored ribosome-binding protein